MYSDKSIIKIIIIIIIIIVKSSDDLVKILLQHA